MQLKPVLEPQIGSRKIYQVLSPLHQVMGQDRQGARTVKSWYEAWLTSSNARIRYRDCSVFFKLIARF